MKYLKYFKEQLQNNGITEICDSCFAYLYDKGFSTKVNDDIIYISKNSDYFYWDEIKDSFLTLIDIIENIDEVKIYLYKSPYSRINQKFMAFKTQSRWWEFIPLDKLEEIMNRDGAYGHDTKKKISNITITLK